MSLPAFALPVTLNAPTSAEREAISDAIVRALLAIDVDDPALFDSALTPDAVFQIDDWVMKGLPAIHTECLDPIFKLETTHSMTSPRITIHPDGKTAAMTCTSVAQHYRRGTGKQGNAEHLLAGSLYGLDLVKVEDGLWKIKYWNMKLVWTDGERSILHG